MKLITIALLGITATGCATKGMHLSDNKEGWFNSRNMLYYCSSDNKTSPVCYKATMYNKSNQNDD